MRALGPWLSPLAFAMIGGCAQPPAALPEPTTPVEPESAAPLDPLVARRAYAAAARAAFFGEAVAIEALPPELRLPAAPVHVGLYGDEGALLWSASTPAQVEGTLAFHTLEAALVKARAALDPDARVRSISVEFAHDFVYYDALAASEWATFLGYDDHRYIPHLGLLGDAVGTGELSYVRPPSEAIATNRSFEDHFRALRNEWRLSIGQQRSATFATFAVDSWHLSFEPLRATPTLRGNEVVELAQVDAASVSALAEGAAHWLSTNIDEHGALRYGYSPSEDKVDTYNNAIRQWNATRALLLWTEASGDPHGELAPLLARNIAHNLGETFHFEGNLGVVELRGRSKLGGLALAGLALARHDSARWAKQITGLRATIRSLFHPDGHFTSFYRGSSKEYWDFYPGEAMLLWAELYAEDPDPIVLRNYQLAFEFHRDWHLGRSDPKPSFAPWHIHANAELLAALARHAPGKYPGLEIELLDFSLELADALVRMQQGAGDRIAPDELGRFYAPDEGWGKTRSSSTGIYTWALVAAFELARDAGQHERAERYRRSVLAGLRSLMQLQFVDEIDMFYVPLAAREALRGGLRTNVSDNEVRLDNVHYCLLAALAALDAFAPTDFDSAATR